MGGATAGSGQGGIVNGPDSSGGMNAQPQQNGGMSGAPPSGMQLMGQASRGPMGQQLPMMAQGGMPSGSWPQMSQGSASQPLPQPMGSAIYGTQQPMQGAFPSSSLGTLQRMQMMRRPMMAQRTNFRGGQR